MKAGVEHRVPLSRQVFDLLREAQALRDESVLVFPSPLKPGSAMSDMTLTKVLRSTGLAERATVHGFRSSFKNWALEQTNTPWVVSEEGAKVYTDEAAAYHDLPNHEAVRHSAREFVHGQAHTNGIESFWAMLKRGYVGTYHNMSVRHIGLYVNEFAGRHNARQMDTADQMGAMVHGAHGKRMRYADLTAS